MQITPQLDYQVVLANKSELINFVLQLQAPVTNHQRSNPAAFGLVLDRSGSMQGVPLDRAKEAAKLAIKNLRPNDLFSLVVFHDTAQVAVPLQPAKDKQALYRKVDAIHSGGSTNLTAGWMLGADELRKAPPSTTRRALLLTDGHLNVGIVDPTQVQHIVASGLEKDGIRSSCLGFGDAYNEDLLAALARATNGVFYDAVSPEKFPAIFDAELQGLQKLAAQNVRVRLKRLDFCEEYFGIGDYPPVELPDGRHEYPIGDLVSGEERIVAFGVFVLPLPLVNGQPVVSLEGEQLLEVEVLWDEITAEGITAKTYTQVIRIQPTQDPAKVVANPQVIPWVALQRAGQAITNAIQKLDAQDTAAALAILQECETSLRRYGPGTGAEEALQKLNELKARITAGEWDARSRKGARYLAASYVRMSSAEYWSAEESAPSFKLRQRPSPPPAPNPDPAAAATTSPTGTPPSAPPPKSPSRRTPRPPRTGGTNPT